MRVYIDKVKKILFLFFLAFLLFPQKAFAAINITNISPTTINLPEDVITISVTTSNLSSATQYLQVAFTKQGETANYFGYTKNNNNSWYLYKSSPTTDDFSSTFFSFTPVSGSWNGEISAKIDSTDTGFKGSGEYTVKVRKYISSSTPTDSNDYIITINYSVPTQTSTPVPTNIPAPTSTPTNSPTPKNTPTPTPTPTPTNIPTPTKTPSPTLTPKPTSTPKTTQTPSSTPIPTAKIPSPTQVKTTIQESVKKEESVPTAILGETAVVSPSVSPTTTEIKEATVFDFSKYAIGIGFIFVIGSGILAFLRFNKEKFYKNNEE